ncbi:MAG: S-layer homology domain-containing protein [Clostridia bacterium]|nr:S-layer homology domain-containing protein [Clostridia bacterium]
MKKRMLIAAAAAFLTIGSEYAGAVDVQKNGSEITLTGKIDSGSSATAIVVKADKSLNDVDWYVAVKESEADETGNVKFMFAMPEELYDSSLSDGEYRVYWKQTGKEMDSDTTFLYISEATRIPLENALTTAASKDALAEVINNTDNNLALKALGFKIDSYLSLSNKDEVLTDVYAAGGTSVDNIRKGFNEITVVSAVKSAESASEVAYAISGMEFSFNNIIYDKIEDADRLAYVNNYIYNSKQLCSNYTALLQQYDNANIFYEINNARFDQIQGVLELYAAELGINGNSIYTKYLQKVNGRVNETLVSNLNRTNPTTVSELLTAMDASLPETNTNGGSNGYTGGGSFGGSSIGSGVIVTAPETPVSAKITFADVPDTYWAADAVYAMTEKGIIAGDGSGSFRPNAEVTREEFVKMIVVAAQLYDEDEKCSFTDVDENSWAYSYIASAVAGNVIKGVSETEFGFGKTLTRQDMAVICERTMKAQPEAIRENIDFLDEYLISEYAKDAVKNLYSAGLINGIGDGNFAPLETATRAQAAQIIYNIFVQ